MTMFFVLCALVLVSQVAGQEEGESCSLGYPVASSADCTCALGLSCYPQGGDFRGTCGPYLQEGESCSLGYPVASSADCTCALGLSCYPEGGWFSGACRTTDSQTYPPVVGPLPVG
uniref:Prokineticin domain-containing protein n=1 Tax=Branchiostoma floridae TaxID=7739 RepID=C3Z0J1_BRAFL|eukprot:XP_002598027.1 hypothetical protein BRAFLDRAFT_79747 [Branchiostoma floridae]